MLKFKLSKLRPNRIFPLNSFLLKTCLDRQPHLVLAGGSLLSLLNQKTHISDYDIFILSKDNDDLVFKKQRFEKSLLDSGFKQTFKCPKNELSTFTYGHLKVQIINVGHKIYDSPESIVNDFDFDLCRIAYNDGFLYITKQCIRNFKYKFLSINKITYPSSTINRLYKYKKKGYNIYNTSREIVEHISNNIRDGIPMDLNTIYVD